MNKQLIALMMMPLLLAGCGVETVDTGEVGIKKTFGKPEETPLTEGLYFLNPFTSSIVTMTYRVQSLSGQTNAYTKDVQQAAVTYTVNLALQPKFAVVMYQNVGLNWQETLVPQVVTASIKNVIGSWVAMELVGNRSVVTKQIEESIVKALASRNVTVSKFELTNIDFSNEFEQAVEAKVVAQQEAERSKNQTVTVREQADQKLISAKAEAEAMQIKTEALAKSQSLVLYEAVQRWDGKLPTMITGDSSLLMNVAKPQ